MLSKFSVKKPLTVIVAVLLIILLGVIAFLKMPVDLFPEMDLPYVAVITTYPGASPEKVEVSVTKPLERVFATTSGIEKVSSVSNENYSMVVLQFAQGSNMDSVMIELNNKVGQVGAMLDDMVSTPQLLQINPDMIPVFVASVDMDGKTIGEVSDLVNDAVIPAMERISGVASVEGTGLIEKKIRIALSDEKIEAVNKKIARLINGELDEKGKQLEEGMAALSSAKTALAEERKKQSAAITEQESQIASGKEQLAAAEAEIGKAESELSEQESTLKEQRDEAAKGLESIQSLADGFRRIGLPVPSSLQQQIDTLESALSQIDSGMEMIRSAWEELSAGKEEIAKKKTELAAAEGMIADGKKQLEAGLAQGEAEILQNEQKLREGQAALSAAEEEALAQANLNGKITPEMLSGILMADNFAMPAGYLIEDGEQFAVKVGDAFASIDEMKDLELIHLGMDGMDAVKLADVADVEIIDNADAMYAKINGNDGVLLTFQKQSTSSTTEVSKKIRAAIGELEEEYPGMHITAMSDQGVYIDIIIDSVLNNLYMGAALAIIILFLFLRKIKPTFIVALSIPISVLFAVALMYFTGVTMNLVSLAGLALGIGMLVDNSIVVIENIYRLRAEGTPAKEAAVRGAGQMAGAITASTLTTICVFVPIVFTEGISRQLFVDMGLTIAYSLVASLIIALTLVPTLAFKLPGKANTVQTKFETTVLDGYGRLLHWALRRKIVVLALALLLLLTSGWAALRMGLAFMPESDEDQLSVSMACEKGTETEDVRAMADEIAEIIRGIDGVETVGAMQGGGMLGMLGGGGGDVSMYVLLSPDRKATSGAIAQEIVDKTAEYACTISASGGMSSMTSMMGSGLQVNIKGDDMDELQRIAKEIAGMMGELEGTMNVSDGLEENGMETRVLVDKNKALQYGLTVAQVYQAVSEALTTESTATTLNVDLEEYPVILLKGGESLTRDTLGDFELDSMQSAQKVKLSEIAEITEVPALSSIHRDDQVRMLTVSAEIDAAHNVGLVGRELDAKLAGYTLPKGYSIEVSGENESINEILTELFKMIGLAIIMVYLIMVAQFQSFMSPFIVMFTIPLAFTGGLLALWLCRMELSAISMIGFLVLTGVVVNNGIVFVDCANQLKEEGMEQREALIASGKMRMRPILMTALTTILGLGTLALGIGTGADMLQPMAVVTIGGLAYATLLTLFVVPALYDLLHRKKKA